MTNKMTIKCPASVLPGEMRFHCRDYSYSEMRRGLESDGAVEQGDAR